MDIADQLARACFEGGGLLGGLGGGGEGGLVVEAVEVAAGSLELLDPLLGLAGVLASFGCEEVDDSGGGGGVGCLMEN